MKIYRLIYRYYTILYCLRYEKNKKQSSHLDLIYCVSVKSKPKQINMLKLKKKTKCPRQFVKRKQFLIFFSLLLIEYARLMSRQFNNGSHHRIKYIITRNFFRLYKKNVNLVTVAYTLKWSLTNIYLCIKLLKDKKKKYTRYV